MKIFCCYTPSHTKLYHDDFLPTIPDGFTLHSEVIELFGKGHYESPQFVPCVGKKVDLILQSLRENAGNVIIWSDVDLQFYKLTPDIALGELGDHDIAFQAAGVPPNEINSGFFICHCNERVINFFEEVRRSLCNENSGEIEERVINKLLPRLSADELSWRQLPRSFYARSNYWPPPRDLVLYHANQTPGANGLELKHRQLREMALLHRYRLPMLLYTCMKYAPRRIRRMWKAIDLVRPASQNIQVIKSHLMSLLPYFRSARLLPLCAFVAGIIACDAPRACADVLFSTLGPGDTYNSSFSGLSVNGQNASGTLFAANAFQPLFDGNLLSIDLGITNYDIADGGSGGVVLHLYANDTATNMPVTGIDLATGTVTATAATGSTSSALTTFTYSGPALLLSHTLTYWLVLAPASENTTVQWQQSLPAVPGRIGTSPDGTTFDTANGTLEAFRVNAAPVPEPATWLLGCTGGILLLRRLRITSR